MFSVFLYGASKPRQVVCAGSVNYTSKRSRSNVIETNRSVHRWGGGTSCADLRLVSESS